MNTYEVNFDGLIGPTHNYAGLSYGNLASTEHALAISNPRAAVLQGLEKMKLVADLGVRQGIIPPQERPDVEALRRLGFRGSERRIVEDAAKEAPNLLAACYSASSMWTANAASVSPSTDSLDGRVHITPANLVSTMHRFVESAFTAVALKAIFHDESAFVHHTALPGSTHFSDEGAANHTRLCVTHAETGIHLFVYGRSAFHPSDRVPHVYPARQALEASQAIARLHRIVPSRTVFACQNPVAVDSGVFHNDVISVGNENVFLYHSSAFLDTASVVNTLSSTFERWSNDELISIEVSSEEVPLADAVASYLFNSQLITQADGSMCLIAPVECEENENAASFLARLISEPNPISGVQYVDLRQSMHNGGGPACLRLRVVLAEQEYALTHQGVYLTDQLYKDLRTWANRHYRDRLRPEDLADPSLPAESRSALDELTQILKLGSLYGFQKP